MSVEEDSSKEDSSKEDSSKEDSSKEQPSQNKIVLIREDIVLVTKEVDLKIVELLKEALELAESGELCGIAISAVLKDGATQYWWGGMGSITMIIGAVAKMHFSMLKHVTDQDDLRASPMR